MAEHEIENKEGIVKAVEESVADLLKDEEFVQPFLTGVTPANQDEVAELLGQAVQAAFEKALNDPEFLSQFIERAQVLANPEAEERFQGSIASLRRYAELDDELSARIENHREGLRALAAELRGSARQPA